MPTFRPLTLHPDREPWDIQPTETAKSYERFEYWLNLRPSARTCTNVAQRFNRSISLIAQQADAHQWRERARLYDAHRARQRRQQNEERDDALSQINMASAMAAADVTRRSIEYVRESGIVLEPLQLKAWVTMMLDLRRAALDTPDQVVRLETDPERPLELEVSEFAGLSPEGKRARAEEIMAGVRRLYAIDGGQSA